MKINNLLLASEIKRNIGIFKQILYLFEIVKK